VEQAANASSSTGLTWIDVKFEGPHDPQAGAMLTALGIHPQDVPQIATSSLEIGFDVTGSTFHGVAWMDDQTGLPAEQLSFTWNANRLVTMRVTGDQAIAAVQQQITERASALLADPSTVLGVVLQMLLAGVQQGLAQLATHVAALDEQILATSNPNGVQSKQLAQLRTSLDPLALRFPAYEVNVGAAMIDPQTISGMTPGGVAQLQAFSTQVNGTVRLIEYITSAMRDTVQDLQAQVAGWQGNRINQLTIVTILFLPVTFLTGYFGMNFTWLDNQLNSMWSYLFWGVLIPVVILLVSVGLLIRKGFTFTGLFTHLTKRRRKSESAS
jgi:Mg2+ and Co2+ transporter CorA